MARGNQQITNFTSGELDPELLGRTDLKNYFNAAEKLRNVLVVPQGGAERRPGSCFRDEVPSSVNFKSRFNEDNNPEGWSSQNSTVAVADGVLTFTGTAADPALFGPSISPPGSVYRYVRVRLSQLSAAGNWEGTLFYTTAGHGNTSSFRKTLPEPVFSGSDFIVLEFDMWNLTEGGDDWKTNTILSIRLDLDNDQDGAYAIDWVGFDGESASDTRAINFEFSTDQHYLFLLYRKGAKIYRNGAEVADIELPYSSDELRAVYDADGNLVQSGVTWSQSYDTLLLFHEDYPIQRIQRQGADNLWLVDDWPFKNIPFFDFGIDYSIPFAATGSVPNGTGGSPENLVDNNDATDATITAPFDFTGLPFDQRRIFQIDLGEVQTLESLRWVNLNRNASALDFGMCYSEDGINWTQIGEEQSVAAADVSYTLTEQVQARFVAIYGPQANITSGTWNCAGLDAFSGRVGVDQVVRLDFDQTAWNSNDETFSLTLEGEKTDPIDYNDGSDAAVDELAENIQIALRKLPNTSTDGIIVAREDTADVSLTITFAGDDGSRPWPAPEWEVEAGEGNESIAVSVTTAGQRPGERTWSNLRGYPRCGTFHQGRLIAAGTKSRPSTVWLSRAGDVEDFNNQRTTDDYGIEATADTDQVASIFAVNAGRHLQFFASSAEFYVPSSDVEPITPTTFSLRRSTQRGCVAGLPVFDVDGATMFVQRGGETLREFIFTDTELAYQSNAVSLLSSHLMRVPGAYAYKRAEDTRAADYLLMANGDKTLTTYCTLRTQEVNAFTLQETEGGYHDIQIDLNEIYQVVERDYSGDVRRYLEIWDDRMRFDCGVADFDVTTPITTITDIGYLDGATVGFIVDDVLRTETAVVAGGTVDLPVEATSSWQLGIPFKNVSEDTERREYWIQLLSPELNLQDGPVFGNKYRNQAITLKVKDTTGVKVNGERMPLDEIGNVIADQAAAPYTGDLRMRGFGGWGFNEKFDISDDRAGNLKLLAVLGKVAV